MGIWLTENTGAADPFNMIDLGSEALCYAPKGVTMRRRRHEWAPKGIAMRRGLVKRLGCLRRASQHLSGYRASERLSGYRASAWWEYEDRGAWRSLPPDHAKPVELNYVAGCRDCCVIV